MSTPDGPLRIGVVGAGLVGLALACKLQVLRPDATVTVLDKECSVAFHQSGHNSGVVHAGLYYPPGSLKARLCRDGRSQLRELCQEHDIAYEECGKLVIATGPSELAALAEIEHRATLNDVPGLRRVGASEIAEIEPHAVGVAGLHSPSTAIVDFPAVARYLAGAVIHGGGRVVLGYEVGSITRSADGTVEVRRAPPEGHRSAGERHRSAGERHRSAGERHRSAGRRAPVERRAPLVVEAPLTFDRLAICAGLQADRLSRMAGDTAGPAIVPFRGDYRKLVPGRSHLVRGLIYPVPDPRYPFLGVHFTRRVDGSVDIGPNAVLALAREGYRMRDVSWQDLRELWAWPGFAPMARQHWRTGVSEIARSMTDRGFIAAARRFVPDLTAGDVEPGKAGVRAQALDEDGTLVDDFRIGEMPSVTAVRNAPSPAATSCLAIADYLAPRVLSD